MPCACKPRGFVTPLRSGEAAIRDRAMDKWISAAIDYIPQWLDYQMRHFDQPGSIIAVAYKGKLVFEQAFGHADLAKRVPMTPRHRFRVASHSKSFTAAGIMKLREA